MSELSVLVCRLPDPREAAPERVPRLLAPPSLDLLSDEDAQVPPLPLLLLLLLLLLHVPGQALWLRPALVCAVVVAETDL